MRAVRRREEKIENKNVLSRQQNCKTGHFTSWKEGERQGNEPIRKLYVQSEEDKCFTSLKMQMYDVYFSARRGNCLSAIVILEISPAAFNVIGLHVTSSFSKIQT